MLTRLKTVETQRLQIILRAQPAFNVRISALIKAYGAGQSFFNVWHQDYDTVLARLENSFFICDGKNPDFEEIAFFLRFNPFFHTITGLSDTISGIAAFFPDGYQNRCFDFMSFKKDANIEEPPPDIDAAPDLRDVYSVMEKAKSADFSIGEFTPFYVDVSHRIRYGCGRAYLLRSGGLPVSSCLVSAESDYAGLISGVATVPEFRKKGLAAAVVRRACRDLTECGKLPVLECLPPLSGYYAKLGFETTGTVKKLEIESIT